MNTEQLQLIVSIINNINFNFDQKVMHINISNKVSGATPSAGLPATFIEFHFFLTRITRNNYKTYKLDK